MEMLIFSRAEYDRLYNCSKINIHDVPLEKRQRFWLPTLLMTLFIFYHILYIPCAISIWKHRENPCYKLLFYIAVADMICMWFNGFESAVFSYIGAVFCTCPTLIYVSGAMEISLWAAETSAEILLAINRSMEFLSPWTARIVFGGNMTWFWLFLVTCYAMIWFIFYMPVLWNSMFFEVSWNPYLGYIEDTEQIYVSPVQNMHNYILLIVLPTIYAVFCVLLILKSSLFKSATDSTPSFSTRMTFLQVFLISALNVSVCVLYHHIDNETLIIVAHFFWFHIHGVCPLIYLTLNNTIRKDCKKMLFKLIKSRRVTKVHGVTLVMPVAAIGASQPITGGSNNAQNTSDNNNNERI